jgi:predicted permease
MLTGLASDLRCATRFLRTRPWSTAAVVLTLALGLGANIAVFAAVRALIVGPLPFAQPERLVLVEGFEPRGAGVARTSWPDYEDLASQSRSLEAVGALRIDTLTLRADREAERVRGTRATASIFDALRLEAAAGRRFVAADTQPGAPAVALLGHGFWQRRFGGASVLGRVISIDGTPHAIVGVLPRGMEFPGGFSDLWLPLGRGTGGVERTRRDAIVVGRMAEAATLGTVATELAAIGARLESAWPQANRGWSMRPVLLRDSLRRGPARLVGVLWAAVTVVLLITCANIAGMMLARGAERRPEMAIRTALGAGRVRIARQVLVESLGLSLLAGLAGLLVARWGITALGAALGAALLPAHALRIDGAVLLFALGACVATGLACGLAPALDLSRSTVAAVLAQGGRSGTGGRSAARLQTALTLAQIAAAVVLLVSAGALVLALHRMQTADVGFQPDRVLTAELSARGAANTQAARAAFFDAVLSRLAAEPGVVAAAAVNWPPMTSDSARRYIAAGAATVVGRPITAGHRVASPAYGKALGLTLREGRFISEADGPSSARVAVVNATMAARAWPGASALGRELRVQEGDGRAAAPLTVVGVVGDVSHLGPGRAPEPEVFVPLGQEPADSLYLVLRTWGDPAALAPALERIVREQSPDAPLSLVRPMRHVMADHLAAGRTMSTLLAVFAVLALALSATGLLGVIGCLAAQRSREFAIRRALGATPSAVLALLSRRAAAVAGVGLALGAAGGFALTRVLRATVFDGIRAEPAVFGVVLVLVAIVALVATSLPFSRVLRQDPLQALREP